MSRQSYDAKKVLQWIIKETSKPKYTTHGIESIDEDNTTTTTTITNNNNNNNNNKDGVGGGGGGGDEDSKIPVESLYALPPEEREKWMSVILGGEGFLNNRKTLKESIEQLTALIFTPITSVFHTKEKEKDKDIHDKQPMELHEMINVRLDNIMDTLEVIHQFLDKNESVVYKCGGLSLLLHLASGDYYPHYTLQQKSSSLSQQQQQQQLHQHSSGSGIGSSSNNNDNNNLINNFSMKISLVKIQYLSTWILQDLAQNNSTIQSQVYHLNGVKTLLKALVQCYSLLPPSLTTIPQKDSSSSSSSHPENPNHSGGSASDDDWDCKAYHKQIINLRIKLWATIVALCEQSNPNMNVFVMNYGYDLIKQVLREVDSHNVTKESLQEMLRVARFVSYILSQWVDGTATVVQVMDLFSSIQPCLYSLHTYVQWLHLHSKEDGSHKELHLIALDVIYDLVQGVCEFMKRDGQCRKYVIHFQMSRSDLPTPHHSHSHSHSHNTTEIDKGSEIKSEHQNHNTLSTSQSSNAINLITLFELINTNFRVYIEKKIAQKIDGSNTNEKEKDKGKEKYDKSFLKQCYHKYNMNTKLSSSIEEEIEYIPIYGEIIDSVGSILRQVSRYNESRDKAMEFAKWENRRLYLKNEQKRKQQLQQQKHNLSQDMAIDTKEEDTPNTQSLGRQHHTDDAHFQNFQTRAVVLYHKTKKD